MPSMLSQNQSRLIVVLLFAAFVGGFCCQAKSNDTASEPGPREKKRTPLDIPRKETDDKDRLKEWGVPLELEGVPNFYRVTDTLYRSAQPTPQGMANLKKYGFKTVISLRTFHSDREKIDDLGLGYERIEMQAWDFDEKDVIRFLQLATNPKRQPVLVHCQHGADRTGVVIAVYRIVVQNWTKEKAIDELKNGHYGYHTVWNHFVDEFFEDLNVEKLKRYVEKTDGADE